MLYFPRENVIGFCQFSIHVGKKYLKSDYCDVRENDIDLQGLREGGNGTTLQGYSMDLVAK